MIGIRCKNYCGLSCVNGSCPRALREEYEDMVMPGIYSCDECGYYKGCEDCAFDGTAYCSHEIDATCTANPLR